MKKDLSFDVINCRVTRFYDHLNGEMAEWSNAPVLKTGKDASPSRVRIPVSPPLSKSPRIPNL